MVHCQVVESIADILHSVVSVLLIITHSLSISVVSEVVETPPHVHQLNGSAVTIQINHHPERLSSINTTEEESLVNTIDAVVNITAGAEVVVDQRVGLRILLRQSLRPEPGFTSEVWTRILREGFKKM